tara:strand:- start:1087 stop:2679 length:1593 start_codon:yes stop_codon:yes gene_type:complete
MKFYVLLLISISFSAYSQETIDSLRSVWEKEALSQKEIMTNIHEILISNTKPFDISWDLAIEYKNLAERNEDDYHLGNSYSHLALFKMDLAEFEKAREYLDKSLKYAKILKNTNLILQNHAALTSICITEGDFEAAAEFQLKSWDLIKNSNNTFQKARALGNFGAIQLLLKNYEKSYSYTSSALQMFKEDKDTIAIITGYTNLGDLYFEQSKYDTAYLYQDSALNLTLREKDKESFSYLYTLSICYSSLSSSCFHLGKKDLFSDYSIKALELSRQTDNKLTEAETLFTMSLAAKGDSSLLIAKQALIIAVEANSALLISKISYSLYLFYREKKQNYEALEMYELYNLSTKAITDNEALRKLEAYEYNESKDSRHKEYETNLEKKETKTRNYFSIILLISFFSIISLIFFWKRQYRLKRIRKELLAQIEVFKKGAPSGESFDNVLEQKIVQLDKVMLEKHIQANLNESDWAIVQVLYENPAISNKVLAERIVLSVEGTKSSLKKMYSLFEIPSSRNKKLALILKVINLSTT